MTKRILFPLLVFLGGFMSCQNATEPQLKPKPSEPRNLDNIQQISKEFVKAIQADSIELHSFATELLPSEATIQYMREHNINIRLFPRAFDNSKLSMETVSHMVTQRFLSTQQKMIAYSVLKDLSAREKAQYETDTMMFGKIVVEGTEAILALASQNATIEYNIGELVKVNEKWHLFSVPDSSFTLKKKKK